MTLKKSIALEAVLFEISRKHWGVTELHSRVQALKNQGVEIQIDYCKLEWPWYRKITIGQHELWLPRVSEHEGEMRPVLDAILCGPPISLPEPLVHVINKLMRSV